MPVPELPLDAVASVEPEPPLAPVSPSFAPVVSAPAEAWEAPPPPADVLAFPEVPPASPVEPVQPESVQLAPVPPPIQLAPEPVELPPLAAAVPPVDPWLAGAELPPVPAAPPPVAVHPPVPAAELPPVAEPKAPFWKKELSFSRKPKAAAPAPQPAAVSPVEAPAASGPWWKKELSFSRKPKRAAAVATVAVAAPVAAPPAAKTPWWKKEIGGKKAVAAASSTVVAAAEVTASPGAPFWKRGFSMGAPKLQKGSAKAGGKKGSRGAKRLVGLKIGASQLAAARVSNNGVAELEQVARQALPMGIVVGGELREPDALADALKDFFARNKLPKKGVRLGIANNRIGVRIFDIVGVDEEKQLANAIHFRAQETLPIPLDEAVLDYHVLDETVDEEGRNVKRVLLVVAYKELIDRYVGACRKAGITLAGIDLEAFALLRSLAPPTERRHGSARRRRHRLRPLDVRGLGRSRLRVHARARVGRLVAQRRARAHVRHGPLRGRSAQVRSLARRERRSRRPHARADGRRSGHGPTAGAVVRTGARLLAPVLPEPARQPGHRRHRDHGRHRPASRPRRGARAADRRQGPGREPPGPAEGRQARRVACSARVARRRHRTRDRGLAAMRAVNLLPRDAQPGGKSIRNEDPAVVVGSALGLIVIIALAAGFVTAHAKASAEQKKLSAAQIELGNLSLHKRAPVKVKKPVKTKPIIPVPAVTSEEQPRLDAIASAMSTRIAWDRILREFSLVMPDDVTISSLTMSTPTPATPGAASGDTQSMALSGLAYSHDSVARLLSRLMLIPDLSDVSLSSSTASTNGTGVQFSINASVKGAPAPPAPAVTTPAATTDTTTTGASS